MTSAGGHLVDIFGLILKYVAKFLENSSTFSTLQRHCTKNIFQTMFPLGGAYSGVSSFIS